MATRDFFELGSKKTSTGQIVTSFRKNFKITQAELSKMTGIAETNLSGIENDRVEIGTKRAALIATVLGIDPFQLLFPNGVEKAFPKEIRNVRKVSAKIMKKKVG